MPETEPSPHSQAVHLQLQALKADFVRRLPERFEAMRALLDRLDQPDSDPTEVETLHRLVHSLTGTAGTFGLRDLSRAARELEHRLAQLLRAGERPGTDDGRTIRQGIEQLARMAPTRPQLDRVAPSPTEPTPGAAALVHVVADDGEHGDRLRAELHEAGFCVRLHGDLPALRQSFAAAPPEPGDAVVLDVGFAGDDPVGARLLGELGLGRYGRTPVVMGITGDALPSRLAASRAGANHTLSRPIEPSRLVEVLDVLTGRQPPQPYRVLLVDDDPWLLDAQAGVLRAAGMVVRSLSDPLQILAELEAFAPDVLLLDVYMPQASGPELAAALRERDAHVNLPILFLSAETDLTQQLLALNLGGDDFLVKPVQPEHLVAAVTARARRARQAHALRQRLQTTLYEREREHLALDHHAIVSIADRHGNMTYANDLFCQVSGYPRAELLGQSHRLLVAGMHETGFLRSIWHAITAGQVWHGEMCCRRKDGSRYWVESTITPFLDSAGEVYQYITIQTDISHIKAAEAALRNQRDMQRVISLSAAALMAAPPGHARGALAQALADSGQRLQADRAYLYTFSRDGLYMNKAQVWSAPGTGPLAPQTLRIPLARLPWMRERFLSADVLQVPDVDAMPPEARSDQQVLRLGCVRSIIVLPLWSEGQPFGFLAYSVQDRVRHWSDEEMELLRLLRDVMASALLRSWADAALRQSESRLNFLVASSPVIIHTRDAQAPHILRYVSDNLQPLMGLDPGELVDRSNVVAEQVHVDDAARVVAAWPQAVERGELRLEYRLRTGDGGYRWVQEQSRLVRDAAGDPQEVVGYWMDITERKQFESELSAFNHELERRVQEQTLAVVESARFARATLDALSARVVILDSDGRVLAANRAWEAYGAADMVREGTCYTDVCDRECGGDAISDHRLADGIWSVIQGDQQEFLHEYLCRRGEEPRWFLCRVERFPGDGEVRAVVSHENITQMKLAERQQLRSQRLESLGTLAGGVAHDLNNALAPVLMGMTILKEQYPEESRLFDMIEASAQRGTHMVRQLLTFAKGAEGERVPVCPHQVVHELERLIQGSFPKNIQVQIHSPEALPSVMGDPTQLHQVLLNLCVNARDAMPVGGTLSVRLQEVVLDAVYARSIPDAVPGRYVALRVSDTGTGIPPHIQDRIFDPFFTTKGSDKGTGLGLSTVLGIVKGHGGFVQVHSQPGEGTAFTVYLPAAVPEDPVHAVPAGAAAGGRAVLGHGETVLFVDDEAAVREVGRTVLERLGYRPLVATDGADGLLAAADHRKTLSAVITDLHMPHMDGLAFVRALRRTLPELPVILASGRVDETVAAEMQALGVTQRLDKPFTQEQLARALRAVLGG